MSAQWSRLREGTSLFLALWALAAPLLLFPQRRPALTALASLALPAGLLWLQRRGRLRRTPFDLPLLIYLGLSALALLASPLPAASLRQLFILFFGVCGYYGLVSYLAGQDDGQALAAGLRALPLLGAGVALGGLLLTRWPERYLLDLQFVTGRLPHLGSGFTIHHNLLAGVLVLLLLPAIFSWPAMTARAGRRRLAAIIALILLTLLLTQSRNGLLSLAVGLAGGLLWQRGRFRWTPALLVALLLVPLALGGLPGAVHEPLHDALGRLDGSSKAGPAPDESWLERLEMWRAALRLMGDYPATGVGLYQFGPVSRANELYRTIRPQQPVTHAHNLWLQAGAGLGWPGWLAAGLLWFRVLQALRQATEAAPPHARWAGVALGASLCGYLTFNTFDVVGPERLSGLLVWLALALIAAFVRLHRPVQTGARTRVLQLAPLLLLLGLLPWLPGNIAHLQLDRVRLAGAGRLPPAEAIAGDDYRRLGLLAVLQGQEEAALAAWRRDPEAVLFLEGQGLRAFFEQQDAQEALRWYGRALSLDPAAATVWYWQGKAYEELGRLPAALLSFRRAALHGQREVSYGRNVAAMAWEGQGRIMAEQGAWPEARAAFAAASALAPDVADYRQQLADVEKALQEMARPPVAGTR